MEDRFLAVIYHEEGQYDQTHEVIDAVVSFPDSASHADVNEYINAKHPGCEWHMLPHDVIKAEKGKIEVYR